MATKHVTRKSGYMTGPWKAEPHGRVYTVTTRLNPYDGGLEYCVDEVAWEGTANHWWPAEEFDVAERPIELPEGDSDGEADKAEDRQQKGQKVKQKGERKKGKDKQKGDGDEDSDGDDEGDESEDNQDQSDKQQQSQSQQPPPPPPQMAVGDVLTFEDVMMWRMGAQAALDEGRAEQPDMTKGMIAMCDLFLAGCAVTWQRQQQEKQEQEAKHE